MNEWMNEWMNKWMNGQINVRMNWRTVRWLKKYIENKSYKEWNKTNIKAIWWTYVNKVKADSRKEEQTKQKKQ